MKNFFKYIVIITLLPFLNSCDDDGIVRDLDYVTFERSPSKFAITKNQTTNRDINVYASNKTGSDRTYMIQVDPSSTLLADFTVPSSVTIPAGSNSGSFSLSVTDDDTLEFVAQTLIIGFINETGSDLSDPLTLEITEECLDTIVTFNITTDTWPNETTWDLFDLSGPTPTVIASGGPFDNTDDVDDNTLFSFDFCLSSGNYGIAVYDSYGDGGPTYNVTSGGVELVGETTVAGAQSTATFTVD